MFFQSGQMPVAHDGTGSDNPDAQFIIGPAHLEFWA
jgi:hypothetical protein